MSKVCDTLLADLCIMSGNMKAYVWEEHSEGWSSEAAPGMGKCRRNDLAPRIL